MLRSQTALIVQPKLNVRIADQEVPHGTGVDFRRRSVVDQRLIKHRRDAVDVR